MIVIKDEEVGDEARGAALGSDEVTDHTSGFDLAPRTASGGESSGRPLPRPETRTRI